MQECTGDCLQHNWERSVSMMVKWENTSGRRESMKGLPESTGVRRESKREKWENKKEK